MLDAVATLGSIAIVFIILATLTNQWDDYQHRVDERELVKAGVERWKDTCMQNLDYAQLLLKHPGKHGSIQPLPPPGERPPIIATGLPPRLLNPTHLRLFPPANTGRCRYCGLRNTKVTGTCGGCGAPL